MNVQKTAKGFTIIEVVLVIAIAGLIMLMVFIALPALQSGQRDSARKSDIGIVASAVGTATQNNRGVFPATVALKTQLEAASTAAGAKTTFKGLSNNTTDVAVIGNALTSAPTAAITTNVEDGLIRVYRGYKCNTVAANGAYTLSGGRISQFAVVTRLEGGSSTAFCQDS